MTGYILAVAENQYLETLLQAVNPSETKHVALDSNHTMCMFQIPVR